METLASFFSIHEKVDIVASGLVKVLLWLPSEKAIKHVMREAVVAGFAHSEGERIGIIHSIKAAVKNRARATIE